MHSPLVDADIKLRETNVPHSLKYTTKHYQSNSARKENLKISNKNTKLNQEKCFLIENSKETCYVFPFFIHLIFEWLPYFNFKA